MTSSSQPRVAVVTGAARGIGLASAQWFLNHGYQVALIDHDAATLAQTDKQFNNPEHVLAVNCDVSKPEQVTHAVSTLSLIHI
jgi:meso-butanediol dehydrogenase/(S,S)-butanediol dehydrogenase/diacetyl reductase